MSNLIKSTIVQSDHSGCFQPPLTSLQKLAFRMRPLYYNATSLLASAGGWEQREWSPCSSVAFLQSNLNGVVDVLPYQVAHQDAQDFGRVGGKVLGPVMSFWTEFGNI